MSGLYDDDILLWSERQAALLRRVASGERINDPDLDWPNIIEEVESVGRSDLRRVEGLLFQAVLHTLKAEAWQDTTYVYGWQAETRGFLEQASFDFAPSMRQRIDLSRIYAAALRAMPEKIDGRAPLEVPATCPYTLDELLSRD